MRTGSFVVARTAKLQNGPGQQTAAINDLDFAKCAMDRRPRHWHIHSIFFNARFDNNQRSNRWNNVPGRFSRARIAKSRLRMRLVLCAQLHLTKHKHWAIKSTIKSAAKNVRKQISIHSLRDLHDQRSTNQCRRQCQCASSCEGL